MLIKLIAFAAAVIPVILFLRAIFARRPSKLGATMREAKKQIDFAIYIFIGLIGCLVVFAAGKLAWSWWTAV
jgi:hypothetical protein